MHWLTIGLAIGLVVCVLLALELLRRLRRRSSRDVEAQVAATVESLEARLDELAQELGSAVSRAEEEAQRSRFLGQIATTIDLDDAIGSTLQAAAALPSVDAASVVNRAGSGLFKGVGGSTTLVVASACRLLISPGSSRNVKSAPPSPDGSVSDVGPSVCPEHLVAALTDPLVPPRVRAGSVGLIADAEYPSLATDPIGHRRLVDPVQPVRVHDLVSDGTDPYRLL